MFGEETDEDEAGTGASRAILIETHMPTSFQIP